MRRSSVLLGGVSGLFFAFLGLVLLLKHLNGDRQSPQLRGTPSGASVTPANPSAAPKIIFASLSGNPPRYFDSGPDQGMGWAEYETQEIRKGLAQDGFQVQMEWMTPARIEHEFKVGSPICTWPVEWRDPKTLFKQRPDRIYSVPLDLRGQESSKVLFRKAKRSLFQKHLKKNGDLDIDSLVADTSLKSLLVRDKSYGGIERRVTELLPGGEQAVKKEYRRNFSLLVIRDNRQLIEMLNADRFDYVIASVIEPQDFLATGLRPDSFEWLTYQAPNVLGLRDPNLTFVSIACAVSSTTIQVMPYINRWIQSVRGINWVISKYEYRAVFEPTLGKEYIPDGARRNFAFGSGEADWWYSLQQSHFPSLLASPKNQLEVLDDSEVRAPALAEWTYSLKGDELLIFNQASYSVDRFWRDYLFAPMLDLVPSAQVVDRLKPEQIEVLKNFDETAKRFGRWSQLSDLLSRLSSKAGQFRAKQLVLFARGVKSSDFSGLLPLLKEATSLRVFFADGRLSAEVLKHLPDSLEELDLSGSVLTEVDVATPIRGIRGPGLRKLILKNCRISPAQMAPLILSIPRSIEVLSLARNNRGGSDDSTRQALRRVSWPNLKDLDLSFWDTRNDAFKNLTPLLPKRLERLNLGMNVLEPSFIKDLFSRDFPNLTHLDLSFSQIGTKSWPAIQIPPSVRHLVLFRCDINPESIRKIIFPPHLETLVLSRNQLSGLAVTQFARSLAPSMKVLDLSLSALDRLGIEELLKSSLRTAKVLNLSGNFLRDSDLGPLLKKIDGVEELNLSRNRIKTPLEGLPKEWSKSLVSLEISGNPVKKASLIQLVLQLPETLERLSLREIVADTLTDLGGHLPSSLEELDLSNNQLSNQDLESIAKSPPHRLKALDLAGSAFDGRGAKNLEKLLTPALVKLNLNGVPLSGQSLVRLSRRFSGALADFSFGPVELDQKSCEELAFRFPTALHSLRMRGLRIPESCQGSFFSGFPSALRVLGLDESQLTQVGAKALAGRLSDQLIEAKVTQFPLGDAVLSPVLGKLPSSVEYLDLSSTQLADEGLNQLADLPFAVLGNASLNGNLFGSASLNRFFKKIKVWNLNLFSNRNLDDHLFEGLLSGDLEYLVAIGLNANKLSIRSIERLLRVLPPFFYFLELSSTHLRYEDVDRLIQFFPRAVKLLGLGGVPIGERGREKLKKLGEDQEKRTGIDLTLVE